MDKKKIVDVIRSSLQIKLDHLNQIKAALEDEGCQRYQKESIFRKFVVLAFHPLGHLFEFIRKFVNNNGYTEVCIRVEEIQKCLEKIDNGEIYEPDLS